VHHCISLITISVGIGMLVFLILLVVLLLKWYSDIKSLDHVYF
jgi:hypothetical protein